MAKAAIGSYVLDKEGTTDKVGDSSTAEETLYSCVIPGGTLGTDSSVVMRVAGEYFNDTGAARTITIRVKFGSTTMWQDASSVTNSNTKRPVLIELRLQAQDSASSQKVAGFVSIGGVTAVGAGLGPMSGSYQGFGCPAFSGTATEASASDKTLSVTIQFGTSSASMYIDRTMGQTILNG